jgi:hypothetical protein
LDRRERYHAAAAGTPKIRMNVAPSFNSGMPACSTPTAPLAIDAIKLNEAINAGLADPKIKTRLADLGSVYAENLVRLI